MDPTQIFISHAHADREIIKVLETRLKSSFEQDVKVFATALEESIKPGEEWFDRIRKTIRESQIALFVVTPRSLQRPWLWWEMGAFWEAHAAERLWMVPLLVGVLPNQLQAPLDRLQSKILTDTEQLKTFWDEMCRKVGKVKPKGIKYQDLATKLITLNAELEAQKAPSQPVITDKSQQDLIDALKRLIQSRELRQTGLSIFQELGLIEPKQAREIEQSAR